MNGTNGRACTDCKYLKGWSEFSLQPRGTNGRASICNPCKTKRWKERYSLYSQTGVRVVANQYGRRVVELGC